MSKQIGAIFTILGGVFYIIGSIVASLVFGILGGFLGLMLGAFNPSLGVATTETVVLSFLGFGVFAGALIIVGGVLLNSDDPARRKSGGILSIAMMIIGVLPAIGGFLIGFVFILIGTIIGLTYKQGSPDIVIGVRSVSPGQEVNTTTTPKSSKPAKVRFCIKCGQPLHEGAAFCASCGASVPE